MLYDRDNSGYLDRTEVIHSIQTMLKFQDGNKDYHELAEECFNNLDTSKNGRVSKSRFFIFIFVVYFFVIYLHF